MTSWLRVECKRTTVDVGTNKVTTIRCSFFGCITTPPGEHRWLAITMDTKTAGARYLAFPLPLTVIHLYMWHYNCIVRMLDAPGPKCYCQSAGDDVLDLSGTQEWNWKEGLGKGLDEKTGRENMDDHNYPSPSPKRRKCSVIKSSETPAKIGLESTTVTTTAETVIQDRGDHMTDSPEDFVKQADDKQQFQNCFPRQMTATSINQSSQRKEPSRSFAHLPTGFYWTFVIYLKSNATRPTIFGEFSVGLWLYQ